MSNTYTEAENQAAKSIALDVEADCIELSIDYAPESDREVAAEALRARVAEMLLGDAFVVMPRYVLEGLRQQVTVTDELRKQLEDVQ